MDLQAYVDEIKFKLTGGVLDLEIDDSQIVNAVNAAVREVQRYIDSTKYITVKYKHCIDLKAYHVSSVSRVYRTRGFFATNDAEARSTAEGYYYVDPMYASMWTSLYGYGNIYNTTDWIYNIAAYNTTLQIANTMSTDLQFQFDKSTDRLYVTCSFNTPQNLTVEYVPIYQDVSDITSSYWIDIIARMSLAITKTVIGRVRSKFTQTNSLWQLDTGILEEGNNELAELRTQLDQSTQLVYGID